jgi:peroxiredoxin
MSRRDIARIKFIQKYRRKVRIRQSLKLSFTQEMEFLRDVQEGTAGLRDMKYKELVDHINRDIKALEFQDRPIMLYKDEQATLQEIRKE